MARPIPAAAGPVRSRFPRAFIGHHPVDAIARGDFANGARMSADRPSDPTAELPIRHQLVTIAVLFGRRIALGSTAMYQRRALIIRHHPSEHRMGFPAAKWARRMAGPLVCLLILAAVPAAFAAERSFPDDGEFVLEAKPMKGSKRVPILEIESQDAASIDLWCNRVHAQFVVVGDTVTIILGAPTEPQYSTGQQCDPDRMRADDDLIAALQQVETWRRQDDVLVLQGQQALRFRLSSH